MKTLLLMRHAKSSRDDPEAADHERPLNRRGRKTAPKMGRLIREQGLLPDVVLCSTAVRTRETCELVLREWKHPATPRFLDDLYLCPAETIGQAVRRAGDDAERVLVIGHNPGLADFLAAIVGNDLKFPTGAVAWLTAEIARWSDFRLDAPLTLRRIWRPKELD
jgi:phosphohistidine phosphatase